MLAKCVSPAFGVAATLGLEDASGVGLSDAGALHDITAATIKVATAVE
jgi:hypothetical protein